MAKNKLIASIAITAGLLGGGVAGVVLGFPGVSGAQTTTTVPNSPSTTAPDGTGPAHDGKNCPHMGGGTDGTTPGSGTNGTSTGGGAGNVGFRHGPGDGGSRV